MNLEHLDKNELQRFRDRGLDHAQMSAAILHLARCRDCMEVYRTMFPEVIDMKHVTGFVPEAEDIEAAFHLDYDEHLEPYVKAMISEVDREIVEGHIKTCGHCAAMLRDLQEFRDLIEAAPVPKNLLDGAGILERIATAVRSHFGVLAFSAIVLLIVAGILFYKQNRESGTDRLEQVVTPVNDQQDQAPSVPEAETVNAEKRDETKEPEIAALKIPGFLKDLKAAKPGVLRGDDERLEIEGVSPNGIVVRRLPSLSWQPVEGVELYEVSVFDENDQRITGIDAVKGTTWRPSGLRRGQVYQWQVTASSTKDPAQPFIGQGKFYLTSEAEEASITKAPNSLARGKALAEAGLIREAEAELRSIQRSDPSSAAARVYLQQISSLR